MMAIGAVHFTLGCRSLRSRGCRCGRRPRGRDCRPGPAPRPARNGRRRSGSHSWARRCRPGSPSGRARRPAGGRPRPGILCQRYGLQIRGENSCRVDSTGLGADFPRPQRAASVMVSARSCSFSMSPSLSFPLADPGHHLMHALDAQTAGDAFPAGLLFQEIEEIAGHVDHAGSLHP